MTSPTKYNPDYCRQVVVLLSRHGFKMSELAVIWGVAPCTINYWRNTHPDFDAAVIKGKDLWHCKDIEKSLRQRAKGYSYNEEKTEYERVLNPLTGEYDLIPVKITKTRKRMAPNVQAQGLYLKHRDPERWPNLNKVEVKTDDGLTDVLKELGNKLPE